MARKSRKDIELSSEKTFDFTLYNVALYIRLSVEDNKKGNSIETQQSILQNFIALMPDLKQYDIYIDNGLTGTNYERPEFKRMMADVEIGNVNCIIVKDLSRLGRNAIDTGYYIEKYFPTKNIRFISVNDNFDTANVNSACVGIILPLKNMINEAYALDISRKIRAQAKHDMEAGKYIGGRPPYGYSKAPNDCHKLIVDTEVSHVVKQIFEWYSDGIGVSNIVVRLNEANILTPSEHAKNKGLITHENLMGNGNWQTHTVNRILSAEVYMGDMVQGKTKSVRHNQKKVENPEEWIVVRNTHEPIISRELFEKVKCNREKITTVTSKRTINPYTENIFKSKVFCACCGGSLHRQRNHDVYYYHCIANDRIAKGTCEGVFIKEKELVEIVLSTLREHSKIILGKQVLVQKNDARLKAKKTDTTSQITMLKQKIDTQKHFLSSLYENLVTGVITSSEYFEMKSGYEVKIKAATSEITALEQQQREIESQLCQYFDLADTMKDIAVNNEFNRKLVEKLIDRVLVSPDKRVEISFLFQNEFKQLFQEIAEVEING